LRLIGTRQIHPAPRPDAAVSSAHPKVQDCRATDCWEEVAQLKRAKRAVHARYSSHGESVRIWIKGNERQHPYDNQWRQMGRKWAVKNDDYDLSGSSILVGLFFTWSGSW